MTGAIANHLWQSTLFGIAAAAIVLLLSSYQAKVRFWIWFAASVKFVVPFSILMSLGMHFASRADVRQAPIASPASLVAVRIAEPFAPAPLSVRANHTEHSYPGWMFGAIASVWGFGSLAIAWKRWREWRGVQSALRASTEAPIRAEVAVRYCPGLVEPFVIGWRRPVLLLPRGIAEVLSAEQLRAVIAHEVCHVRRRDNALAAFHMVIECLFWFHPLVWWIGAQMIVERERACDEDVLRAGMEPYAYAEGLVAVCKQYARSPLAASSGVTGWSHKKRIEEIMSNRESRELDRLRRMALVTMGVAAVALPFATGMLNAPLLHAQATPGARFDSVRIRRCSDLPNEKTGGRYRVSEGVLMTGCMPLADQHGLGLIQRAYVRFAGDGGSKWPAIIPVKGRPSWFDSERYEVIGRSAANTPHETMEGSMLRVALQDQFKLIVHEEAVDVPVYGLTIAPGGPKLTGYVEGSCTEMPLVFPPPQLPPGQRYCAVRAGTRPPSIDAEGVTLAEFAKLLSLVVDKPVIDKTGVPGKSTIHLEFTPDASTPRFLAGGELAKFATALVAGTPNIAGALGQLGLTLEPGTGTQSQLVIDHVERPAISNE